MTSAALSTATDLEADGPWRWWPEQPQESGLYWCITGPMSHGGSLYWWNAEEEQWEHPAMAFRMSPTVTLWMKCPQLPDSMSDCADAEIEIIGSIHDGEGGQHETM